MADQQELGVVTRRKPIARTLFPADPEFEIAFRIRLEIDSVHGCNGAPGGNIPVGVVAKIDLEIDVLRGPPLPRHAVGRSAAKRRIEIKAIRIIQAPGHGVIDHSSEYGIVGIVVGNAAHDARGQKTRQVTKALAAVARGVGKGITHDSPRRLEKCLAEGFPGFAVHDSDISRILFHFLCLRSILDSRSAITRIFRWPPAYQTKDEANGGQPKWRDSSWAPGDADPPCSPECSENPRSP